MTVMGEIMQLQDGPSQPHLLTDRSLILHTSGTSGKKKVVPYTLLSLIVGTCAVVTSWDLRPTDVNCECARPGEEIAVIDISTVNMMPLFHVGGIVRNLLAVRRLNLQSLAFINSISQCSLGGAQLCVPDSIPSRFGRCLNNSKRHGMLSCPIICSFNIMYATQVLCGAHYPSCNIGI